MNLDDYRKESRVRLDISEMGVGIAAANRNARRLLADALLLFESDRFPSALTLSILAMEESVKWWTLAQATILSDEANIVGAWKESADHRVKLDRVFRAIAAAVEGAQAAADSKSLRELSTATQAIKLRSTYSAFVEGRRWVEPHNVVNAAEARVAVGVAAIVTVGVFRMTGVRLGQLLARLPNFLEAEAEEAARVALIAWAGSREARELAEGDDRESVALQADVRARLGTLGPLAFRSDG